MKSAGLVAWALAYAIVPSAARGTKRQSGPVEPDTNPDCTFFDTSYSEFDDCAYFEDFWGVSHSDFVAWVTTPCSFLPP